MHPAQLPVRPSCLLDRNIRKVVMNLCSRPNEAIVTMEAHTQVRPELSNDTGMLHFSTCFQLPMK